MQPEPEVTLNQPLEPAAPAYAGEIYQIYKASPDAKSLPIDKIFAAVEQALNSVPQPAAELAKVDAARKIPSLEQRLIELSKETL